MPAVVNIAGTSGSGKTTAMWGLINLASHREEASHLGKIGQLLVVPGVSGKVYVIGRYEQGLQTCGCDTIKDVSLVYQIIMDQVALGRSVVYEGLFVMNHTRGPAMVAALSRLSPPVPVTVVRLSTSLPDCFTSINERRARQGKGPLLNRDNTEGNDVRATNFAHKMRAAGARRISVTREQAVDVILEGLRCGN